MKFKKILIFFAVIIFISLTIINAIYINPYTITIRKENISTENELLKDLTIVYFSDLHYGTSFNEGNVTKVTDAINQFDPDIVIFGGDLVDHFSLNPLDEESETILINSLSSINANLGKYAVLGNHDIDSPIIKENVTNILNTSEFEILNNESLKVYQDNNKILNIVGIESLALGNPDIESAYRNVDKELYTIALCHTADIFDEIPTDKTNLLLAGHSHGGQIYIPIFNTFYRPNGTQQYFKGRYTKDDATLDITNGVGTTLKDIRLLADAEIVVYKFN